MLLLLLQLSDYSQPKPPPVRSEGATSVKYIELLENNANVIYPLLAVLVLVLLVVGILQAWRSHDFDGVQKAELKRSILLELRKDIFGCTADQLAKRVGLERHRLLKLLEALQQEGILTSHTNTERRTVWQLKGVGPQQHH